MRGLVKVTVWEVELKSNIARSAAGCCVPPGWQELLVTFEQDLAEVALRPGTGGVFEVRADGDVVWSRAIEGRFPEIKELKQRIRDRIAPEKTLGHSDVQAAP